MSPAKISGASAKSSPRSVSVLARVTGFDGDSHRLLYLQQPRSKRMEPMAPPETQRSGRISPVARAARKVFEEAMSSILEGPIARAFGDFWAWSSASRSGSARPTRSGRGFKTEGKRRFEACRPPYRF
jgi:hypothetical protein